MNITSGESTSQPTYSGWLAFTAKVSTVCPSPDSGYSCSGATGAEEKLSVVIEFSNLTIGDLAYKTNPRGVFNYSCITLGDSSKWKQHSVAKESAEYSDEFTRSGKIGSGYYIDKNGKPLGIYINMYTGDYVVYNKEQDICYLAGYPASITNQIIEDIFTSDYNNTGRLAEMKPENAISFDGETVKLSRSFTFKYTNGMYKVFEYDGELVLKKE